MRGFAKVLSAAVFLVLTGCSSDPEQELLNRFFTAVQGGDAAAVKQVSLAPFDGNVVSWEVVQSGPETEGPFELKALEEQLRAKRAEVRKQRDDNATFAGDNRDTYEAYKAKYAEDPSAPFTGELLAFHETWQQRLGRQQQLDAEADQLAFDAQAVRDAAALSVSSSVNEEFDGHVTGKTLQLKINDGSEETIYNFRLIRFDLTDPKSTIPPSARWIIAEIQPGV